VTNFFKNNYLSTFRHPVCIDMSYRSW